MKFHIEFGMLLYLSQHVLSLNVRSCKSTVFSHSLNGNGGGKEHMTLRSFGQPYSPIVLPFESLSYYRHGSPRDNPVDFLSLFSGCLPEIDSSRIKAVMSHEISEEYNVLRTFEELFSVKVPEPVRVHD